MRVQLDADFVVDVHLLDQILQSWHSLETDRFGYTATPSVTMRRTGGPNSPLEIP
jgi:hypothetical protein